VISLVQPTANCFRRSLALVAKRVASNQHFACRFCAKFAYDRKLGTFTLRKSLLTGLTYPHDWGFVPSTKADDDDPLDIMIVHDAATFPGLIVTCRRDIPKPSWFGSVAGGPPFSSHRNFNIPAPLPSTIVQLTARRGDSIG
jgi:inorganic pyrophosphatase